MKSKILILALCLAPVLLTGCETTKNDTSASFDMAPTDIALPETVAAVPTIERKEAPVIAEAAAPAAKAATEAKPASATVAGGVATSDAGSASEVSIAKGTASVDSQVAGDTDMPVMAMAAAAPVSAIPLPEPKPASLAQQARPSATETSVAVPAEEKGVVVNTLAKASDVVEAALTPATYFKADSPRGRVDELISKYAALYEVPVDLVRRVVKRESNFNPAAFHRGHYGLMQIKHATARGMGYQGPAKGLFDAETNLRYSVKYLRGAYMVANGNHDRADRLYQSGYYYHAKRMGLLDETGLGKDRFRRRAKLPES